MDTRIEKAGEGVIRRLQSCKRVAVHQVRVRSEVKTFVDAPSVSETIQLLWGSTSSRNWRQTRRHRIDRLVKFVAFCNIHKFSNVLSSLMCTTEYMGECRHK